jgi:hypothetical protein
LQNVSFPIWNRIVKPRVCNSLKHEIETKIDRKLGSTLNRKSSNTAELISLDQTELIEKLKRESQENQMKLRYRSKTVMKLVKQSKKTK